MLTIHKTQDGATATVTGTQPSPSDTEAIRSALVFVASALPGPGTYTGQQWLTALPAIYDMNEPNIAMIAAAIRRVS